MQTNITIGIAKVNGIPWPTKTTASTAPNMTTSPCAKFAALLADHIMLKPRPIRE
jgi:hypothetical protein